MRARNLPLLSLPLRFLLISAVSVFGVTMLAEIGRAAFTSPLVMAVTGEREAPAAQDSATYHWNLDEYGKPLVNLPDHIGDGLDQSLTYSLDQFEFPLFQSLYYKLINELHIVLLDIIYCSSYIKLLMHNRSSV